MTHVMRHGGLASWRGEGGLGVCLMEGRGWAGCLPHGGERVGWVSVTERSVTSVE